MTVEETKKIHRLRDRIITKIIQEFDQDDLLKCMIEDIKDDFERNFGIENEGEDYE